MSSLVKTIAREVALRTPFLKERFLEWEFRRRGQSFRGIYADFKEAAAAAPSGPLVGYDHKEVALFHEEEVGVLRPNDYPVLFWLAPIVGQARRVFDLGGNIGLALYAYRKYLAFPGDLDWTVCEVPATADVGREYAAKNGETHLHFTADPGEADGCDIYFTAGALQYIEEPFADMIQRLARPPCHLVIQRVPLWKGRRFITLQNNNAWTVPYKIENEDAFIKSLTDLGYTLVDHWRLPRTLTVLNSPKHRVENYQGLYFRLGEDARSQQGVVPAA
jgi:putative methyltransferase (TIGR04325 family)